MCHVQQDTRKSRAGQRQTESPAGCCSNAQAILSEHGEQATLAKLASGRNKRLLECRAATKRLMDHDHVEASGAHGRPVCRRKFPAGDVGKPIPYAGFADFEDCTRGVGSDCAVEPSTRIVREGERIWLIGQGCGLDQVANAFADRDTRGRPISCGYWQNRRMTISLTRRIAKASLPPVSIHVTLTEDEVAWDHTHTMTSHGISRWVTNGVGWWRYLLLHARGCKGRRRDSRLSRSPARKPWRMPMRRPGMFVAIPFVVAHAAPDVRRLRAPRTLELEYL